jgi:hypothetical protein
MSQAFFYTCTLIIRWFCFSRILQGVDNFFGIDPFVGPDPLKERLQQSLMQFILNRERYSLKPRHHRFQPNVVTDLGDEVVIPLPAKARDQAMRREFWRNFQAANMNCDKSCAKPTSNLSQSSPEKCARMASIALTFNSSRSLPSVKISSPMPSAVQDPSSAWLTSKTTCLVGMDLRVERCFGAKKNN